MMKSTVSRRCRFCRLLGDAKTDLHSSSHGIIIIMIMIIRVADSRHWTTNLKWIFFIFALK